MYKPDRVLVRKIKEYDPHLFIEWNNEKGYFELWRTMTHGRRLITPIVQSIYNSNDPIKFVQLDERLLWLIYEWDSWAHGGPSKHVLEGDQRWQEWHRKQDRKTQSTMRDLTKDLYTTASAFYATKYKSKNSGIPDVQRRKPGTLRPMSTRPDMQGMSRSRVFSRSKGNALKFFGGR